MKSFKNLIPSIFLCSVMLLTSQTSTEIVQEYFTPEIPGCIYYENEFRGRLSVPVQPELQAKIGTDTPCSTIVVTYNGFPPEAEDAFQYAVDLWALSVESTQTITIDATFQPLASGTLGSAGSSFVTLNPAVVPDALPNTFYGIPLAEKLANGNINGMDADITANFNSNVNWYFGTDANPPGNQFDFVTVVLHELGHGMGFIGFGNVTNNQGSVRLGNPPRPAIFDNFIENGPGTSILTFADPSIQLGLQLTGGDLFCNGAQAIAGNNGTRPEIFAPGTFNPGSSYSHWDETVFPSGGVNSLMTPQLGPGEAIHFIGNNTAGFLEDMGWTICAALSVDDFTADGVRVSPNPFSTELVIQLLDYGTADYKIKLIDLNGRLILEDIRATVNGEITLSDLSGLDQSFYFLELTNLSSGRSIVKKLLKQ